MSGHSSALPSNILLYFLYKYCTQSKPHQNHMIRILCERVRVRHNRKKASRIINLQTGHLYYLFTETQSSENSATTRLRSDAQNITLPKVDSYCKSYTLCSCNIDSYADIDIGPTFTYPHPIMSGLCRSLHTIKRDGNSEHFEDREMRQRDDCHTIELDHG